MNVLPTESLHDSGFEDYRNYEAATVSELISDNDDNDGKIRSSGLAGCNSTITGSNLSIFMILSLLVKKFNS